MWVEASASHQQDAKYKVGQTVTVDMPGESIKARISKVTFWGWEMLQANYDIQFVRGDRIITIHRIEEWKLKSP